MRRTVVFLLTSMLVFAAGCSQLGKVANIEKPTARLVGTQLAAITFDQADLRFDFEVTNPNPFGINLTGLDYDLQVWGASLLGGNQNQGLKIGSRGSSRVTVPVRVRFADVERIARQASGRDTINYALKTRFKLNLPVLGTYVVPVEQNGTLPLPRVPTIGVANLEVRKLGWTAADVLLKLTVDNPNTFALKLGRLNYQLDVNGDRWGSGNVPKGGDIPARGRGVVTIPLSLDLSTLGASIFQALKDRKPLGYSLQGGIALDTGIELLRDLHLPLKLSGQVGVN